jgi:hypothetical protein
LLASRALMRGKHFGELALCGSVQDACVINDAPGERGKFGFRSMG